MKARKRLTDQAVARIKPPKAGKIELPDGLIPGMQLRVTDRGIKTFALRYRRIVDGKPRRLTLGTYPALSLAEARKKSKAALQEIEEGGDPFQEKQSARMAPADASDDTLAGALEAYKAVKLDKLRRGDGAYRMIRDSIVKSYGTMPLAEIEATHVRAAIRDIEARGAASMANRTLSVIKTFMGWCVHEGMIGTSPAEGNAPEQPI